MDNPESMCVLAGVAAVGALWYMQQQRRTYGGVGGGPTECSAKRAVVDGAVSARAAMMDAEPKTAEEYRMKDDTLGSYFTKSDGFDEMFKGQTAAGKPPKDARKTLGVRDTRLESQTRLGNGTRVLMAGVNHEEAKPSVTSECVKEMFAMPPALEGVLTQ